MEIKKQKVYSGEFWLLCLSAFFFFGSFNMVIPELPAFITKLGGAEYKGLIVALFTLTALISRPFSGKLADTIGRIPIMIFGSVVCVICSLLYPLLTGVFGFLMLRLLHGFSTGFAPTGFTAYIADIVPPEKRGEAMGILGTFGSLGMAASPAIGGWVATTFSLNAMFYCSSAFGLAAVLVYAGVHETLHSKVKFHPRQLLITRADIYEPRVLFPCFIMALTSFAFGIMLTLVPDLSARLGFTNKGAVFAVFTLASVAVRIVAGKISDRYGRKNVVIFSSFLIAVSMLVTGLADSKWMLWVGGALYGIANGVNSPTLFAWITDLSTDSNRGRAFGSLYIALELGIGLGALISGYVYGNNPANFIWAFGTGMVLALIAFVSLLTYSK